MNCGIYLITNVINGKIYIGGSRNTRRRKYRHFYDLKRGSHSNPHLQRAYNSYGEQAFHFEVLEYCTPELLVERENWWIDLLDSRNPEKGYNLCSADWRELSAESRAKISASNRGRKLSEQHRRKISAALKGRTRSKEHQEKLAATHRGKKLSEQQKAKLLEANRGRVPWNKGGTHSEETKAKLSAASKGRIASEETKLKMSVSAIEGWKKRRLRFSDLLQKSSCGS